MGLVVHRNWDWYSPSLSLAKNFPFAVQEASLQHPILWQMGRVHVKTLRRGDITDVFSKVGGCFPSFLLCVLWKFWNSIQNNHKTMEAMKVLKTPQITEDSTGKAVCVAFTHTGKPPALAWCAVKKRKSCFVFYNPVKSKGGFFKTWQSILWRTESYYSRKAWSLLMWHTVSGAIMHISLTEIAVA